MNKAFLVNSTLVIALSFVTSAIIPVMAESKIGSPTKFEASKKLLRAKLANLNYFSANFTQEVVSEAGELLEQSSGELAISKPNLANWHTLEPDELAIVSDGNDVWFYNPWIEQVSVYSLSTAITKTPILLLTSKDELLWQQYTVTQERVSQEKVVQERTAQEGASQDKVTEQGDRFVISAKDPNSQIKSLTLVFSAKEPLGSELSQFSFLDATGQVSHIKLSNFDAQKAPESSLFHFVVPEGVQIDDQRAN
ncbi:MAG: outer membrane lipoprotein carrier protein LolA [Colwellia sp.]|jgi:outer membrane lipoprotein carrier protein|nr:MAG: outer membrane lipoprotein carrier protein LolA [Colwellia sp.]